MRESFSGGARHGERTGTRVRYLGACLLVAAVPLSAQSADQRAQIEAFRDSLTAISDSFPLLTAEKILIAHASHEMRDSATAHVRLGFIAMRLGLQTALGKDALTRSANDFAKSAEVDPSFVRGLVELSNTALRQRVN